MNQLIDDVRRSLPLTSKSFDTEIQTLIDAAIFEMNEVGIAFISSPKNKLEEKQAALQRAAINTYVKANFGENKESEKYMRSFETMKLKLRDIKNETL